MDQDYLDFYSDEWPKPRYIPVPIDKSKTSLDAMAALLQRVVEEKEGTRREIHAYKKAFVKTALDIYTKRKAEYAKAFRSILSILEHIGLKVVTYEGEVVTPELMEVVDIVEWLPAEDDQQPVVVEAFEPEIQIGNRVYHTAKLICRNANERTERKLTAGVKKKRAANVKGQKKVRKPTEKAIYKKEQEAPQNTPKNQINNKIVKEHHSNENQ